MLTFCFPSSLSKFLELEEPWLDSSWHLEVTTEKLEEGLKETLVEGEVGEVEEETVREIEDVCIGEVFFHIYPQKAMSFSPFFSFDQNDKDLQDS